MSAPLLASLRTAATADVALHNFSDLMAYGMFLMYSVAIAATNTGMRCGSPQRVQRGAAA